MSPPAKTPSRLVMKLSSTMTLPARIVVDAETIEKTVLDRTGESHGEQHEIRIHLEVRIRHRDEFAAFELSPVAHAAW